MRLWQKQKFLAWAGSLAAESVKKNIGMDLDPAVIETWRRAALTATSGERRRSLETAMMATSGKNGDGGSPHIKTDDGGPPSETPILPAPSLNPVVRSASLKPALVDVAGSDDGIRHRQEWRAAPAVVGAEDADQSTKFRRTFDETHGF